MQLISPIYPVLILADLVPLQRFEFLSMSGFMSGVTDSEMNQI